jgi:hypothetical protein
MIDANEIYKATFSLTSEKTIGKKLLLPFRKHGCNFKAHYLLVKLLLKKFISYRRHYGN